MTVKKCPECNGDVSTRAKACPHCGTRRSLTSTLLVSGFPVYRPGRVDQESKIEAMRRYGGDLQNILRKRSQVFG
jgi:hypothetical protein